jgi:ECF transporter S component (folate family)
MSKLKDLFILSYKEFASLLCITVLGMFGAISIILGFFVTIMPTETIKITFTFLPNEFVYYLFGPAVGAFFGAAMDLLNFFLKPTGEYFFGFTLSGILTGLLYGFLLYKRPISLKRVIIANVIRVLIIDLLLNTYWLTVMYGYNFMALLPMRALKSLIMFPIETLLLFGLIKGIEATGILKIFRNRDNTVTMK